MNAENTTAQSPIDVSEWAQDIRLPQPQSMPQLFSACLARLSEHERLLAVKNINRAIAEGKLEAIPVSGKPVPIKMLTERGKIETRKITDYWITVNAAFENWLNEKALATVYHLIRTTGQPGLSEADIRSGRFDLHQIREATRAYQNRQPRKKANDETAYKPKKRRRIQPLATPVKEIHESETSE